MYSLSVISDEVSQDLRVATDFALRHNLDGLEIRSVNDRGPFEFTNVDIKDILSVTKETGLKIPSLALPLYKCNLVDPHTRASHRESLKRSLELAALVSCKIVRGFTFWKEGVEMPISEIVGAYYEILPIIEDAGVCVVLETEPSVYTGTAAQLRRVLQAINHSQIQAVWDGANLLYDLDGEQPVEGYDILRPWIRHVHMKDAVRTPNGPQARSIGKGSSDIPKQLSKLAQDQYSGWISLETHYRKTIMDEEVMKRPAGSKFTDGGLEASEESIVALKTMLDEAWR
ncbi:hypothetical protein AGMMS49992_20430 [Clostridia bacterium]|nr:hypothetical protein AGMMS49992_20430 [Clostridia bacterium]